MLTLQFELEYQKINLVNRWETVATDSKNYLVASFSTISDDWTTPITAIFTNDKDEQPYAVVVGADSTLESNECYVPWEVLKDESNVYVSAYCGNLHTTVTAQFHVYKSGYADGEIPPPPSPTVYDAIMQAITNLQNGKQDKLTAGENITISSDNVISAEGGGVTSYEDLTDKPTIIAANSATGYGVSKTLEGVFDFQGFLYFVTESGKTSLQIKDNALSYEMLKSAFQKEIFKDYGFYSSPPADFYTNYKSAPAKNGIWHISAQLEGAPTTKNHRLINYYNDGERIQFIVTDAQNGHLGEEQLFMRGQYMGNMGVWQELTGGGSQIVSGVVNANGTITFTDSEGNTFTTTGSSVIGADGFSPVATVTQTASGATVSITDSMGTTTANISNGQDGNDYVLTAQDKSDIADIVLSELPNADTMSF